MFAGNIIFNIQNSKESLEPLYLNKTEDIISKNVPAWFVESFPMNTSNFENLPNKQKGFYENLYDKSKGIVVHTLILFFLSIFIMSIYVYFVARPLKYLEKIADDITQDKFEGIKKIPKTKEIKTIALALNYMMIKIEKATIISQKNLECSREIQTDQLTKLNLKSKFIIDLEEALKLKAIGYVFSIKVNDLNRYANENTTKTVNQFIQNFATILLKSTQIKNKNLDVYRFYGSEFAILAYNMDYNEAKMFADNLKIKLEEISLAMNKFSIANVGAAPIDFNKSVFEILDWARESYQKSKQIGFNEVYIEKEKYFVRDRNSWKNLVFDIMKGAFEISYVSDTYSLNKKGKQKKIMQEAFSIAKDNDGEKVSTATFLSIVEEYNQSIDFDKMVIKKVLQDIYDKDISHEIIINLTINSISSISFISWLESVINNNFKVSHQLVFSLSAHSIVPNKEEFLRFTIAMKYTKVKVLLKRYDNKNLAITTLKEYEIDYIRLSSEYTNEISEDKYKQKFVNSLESYCTLMGIKLIAYNVDTEKDYDYVRQSTLYAVTRSSI